MNASPEDVLRNLKSELLDGMRRYRLEASVSYEAADVDRCGEILEQFSAAIATARDRTEALAHVRTAVLDLNALNETAGGDLIETDQREMICALIIKTCASRGFCEADEDVTEEWREW